MAWQKWMSAGGGAHGEGAAHERHVRGTLARVCLLPAQLLHRPPGAVCTIFGVRRERQREDEERDDSSHPNVRCSAGGSCVRGERERESACYPPSCCTAQKGPCAPRAVLRSVQQVTRARRAMGCKKIQRKLVRPLRTTVEVTSQSLRSYIPIDWSD
jgi:hypothetical protein